MNQLEKLLQRAKEGEKIIIDQHFKQALKKKILENEQQGSYFPQEKFFWWKRLTIVALPLMVTIVLFFYYYQGELKNTSSISQQTEIGQEDAGRDKQSASVFTNRNGEGEQAPLPSRDILKTSPRISGEAVTGTSSDAERTAPVNMGSAIGVVNSPLPQSAQETNPQKTNLFKLLFGGILLLAIGIAVLFWYKQKKKR